MRVSEPLPVIDSSELAAIAEAVPIETLESSDAVIYATDPKLRLIYANRAWDQFAIVNGAAHLVRSRLGRPGVLDFIRGPLHEFYMDRFAEALGTSKPVEHVFECSSARIFRTFHMRILPLRNGGLLLINSLTAQKPIQVGQAPTGKEYIDNDGLINMCSHCRRTQRVDNAAWEWVPAFVEQQPERVSHGLCPVCLEYHYLSHKRVSG